MTTVTALLTNKAYGFPTRGAKRRVTAPVLACIHITGNRRTAANPDRHQAALDERTYANRAGSNGPSAHYYVARDGWAVEAIDPATYAAWSNGDVASPNTANAGIAKVLALRAKGFNANEAYWLEFECVGYGSTYPITVAQKQFCAARIAAGQGDRIGGEPRHRPRPQRHQQRQPGLLPLPEGEPRGVRRRCHRPGERDPAAAGGEGHREGGRHPGRGGLTGAAPATIYRTTIYRQSLERSSSMVTRIPELGRFAEPALLILVSLSDGPKHGYAIMADVEAGTGRPLGPGTLYAALARLEERGLIEALAPVDRRRPYRLTAVGATMLAEQLHELSEFAQLGLQRLSRPAG